MVATIADILSKFFVKNNEGKQFTYKNVDS